MSLIETWKEAWPSPVGRLRVIGAIEGVSFVLLVGVAMPLKYYADLPMAVRVVGMLHGILFVWLCAEVGRAVVVKGWPWTKGFLVFLAALVPIGPFLLDGWLAKRQAEWATKGTGQKAA